EKARVHEAAKKAAIGGGLSAGVLTGAGSLLSGEKNKRALLIKALLGGALGGATAGGATYLGSKVLGAPEEGAPGAYSHRAGLGGLLGGGVAGAGLGYLAASGKGAKLAEFLRKSPKMEKA